ncbi:MAG: hydrogenase maturation protease [Anaerolineae bacterium]
MCCILRMGYTAIRSMQHTARTMRTLVIGLGNPILTDDGVGVKVACAVRDALASAEHNDVSVTEASVGGLRLMEMMIGYERVILVDALQHPGVRPGSIRRMTLEDLSTITPTQHSTCAHDTSLVTALELGRQMGLPLPKELIIYAVGVENVTCFGEQPTPAVARAIPDVTQAILAELKDSDENSIPASYRDRLQEQLPMT